MPHVQLNDVLRLNLLRLLQRNSSIPMFLRQWEMIEYPLLQENDKTVWAVKSTNNLEEPRYIVLAFQTSRKGNKKASAVQFDHCKISNLKRFLNAELHPYESSNVVWESSADLKIPSIKATQRELEHKILVVRDSVSSVKEELMSIIRSNTGKDVRDSIELHDQILDLTKRVRFLEEDLRKLQPVQKKTEQSDTATPAT
ncbi:hypothetical protein QAD02_020960 [Eretmocerus hayati]|uniref:Uncharacterized protein n=1 Tax=Eretmocerus hayati TaxID=131215 RepID=A0ACC2PS35_9HYME|nr:hypothetical protein QAD02_020960 [Eretmocerus hayati]